MFDVQDPTQRGPFYNHFDALVNAERSYVSQRQQFMGTVGATFPGFIDHVLHTPQATPVTHITDVLPSPVAETVASITPNVPVHFPASLMALWSRFRGRG